jgi:hypothetical protein
MGVRYTQLQHTCPFLRFLVTDFGSFIGVKLQSLQGQAYGGLRRGTRRAHAVIEIKVISLTRARFALPTLLVARAPQGDGDIFRHCALLPRNDESASLAYPPLRLTKNNCRPNIPRNSRATRG